MLTSVVWIALDAAGAPSVVSVLCAFAIGFMFGIVAMYKGWEEPLAVLLPEPPTDQGPWEAAPLACPSAAPNVLAMLARE